MVKLGGSVLDTPADVDAACRHVEAIEGTPVVVVSALQGTTDRLVALAATTAESDPDEVTARVRSRHTTALSRYASPEGSNRLLEGPFDELAAAVTASDMAPPERRDRILATGERLAARVVAAGLRDHGMAASAVDADRIGIVTDGVHGRATARLAETASNIKRPLRSMVDEGAVPVVTGFFGRGPTDEVTTFGRGGSDYSAAIVANALDADRVEVVKDVDGFLTADPHRVSTARPVSFMTYDEAAELAYLGVQVLHPRTLEPLREQGISLWVTPVGDTDNAGTHIGPARVEPDRLRAIGTREGFGIVRMHGSAMAYEPGVGQRVFATLHDAGVNVVNMAASQATFAMLVDAADVDRAQTALEHADIPTVESVQADLGHALVCIVGRNIGRREGVAGRVFSIVGAAGVNVEMISVGSSNVAMSFVVAEEDLDRTIATLHQALFESAHAHDRGTATAGSGDD